MPYEATDRRARGACRFLPLGVREHDHRPQHTRTTILPDCEQLHSRGHHRNGDRSPTVARPGRRADSLSVEQTPRVLRLQEHAGQMTNRGRHREELPPATFGRHFEPDSLLRGERTDPRPPQRLHHPASAELRTEVAGDRAYVGSLPAIDLDVEPRPLVAENADRADADSAGRECHVLPLPGEVVGTLASYLQRRECWWNLLD